MGFDPKKDGRLIWPTIHLLAANAVTIEQRAAYVQFVMSLPVLYPCKKCRIHTEEFLKKNPITRYSESAQLLLYWSWLFHESVNDKLKKPLSGRLSWQQTLELYMSEDEDPYRIENNHPVEKNSVNASSAGSPPPCGECEVEDETQEKSYSIPIHSIPDQEKLAGKRVYFYANE